MLDLLSDIAAATRGSEELDRRIATALNIDWAPDEDGQFGGYGRMPRCVRFTRDFSAALHLGPDLLGTTTIYQGKKLIFISKSGTIYDADCATLELSMCHVFLRVALEGKGHA